jgi:nucleoside phosphorylase
MLCILSALKAESDPLINYFKLDKDPSFSFPVFLNNGIALVAIGVGKKKISDRINSFFLKFKKENIYFLNIGIAGGHSEHSKIGSCYLINKIQDDLTKKSFYPDIIIKHSFKEKDIITVETPISNESNCYYSLVDMEASEIFNTCKNLVLIHHIAFLKIVSDYTNFENQEFDSFYIKNLINPLLNKISTYVFDINLFLSEEKSILTDTDTVWLKNISDLLSLTASQNQIIRYKLIGYRLKNPNKLLPQDTIMTPKSKQHQKKIFKKLNDQISI